jgi:hypothetical protein
VKLSAVMVHLQRPIGTLDAHAADYLRWFLLEFIVGINPEHGRRWRRIVARWFNRGGTWSFYPIAERDGRYHRMHMAVETRLFAHQDAFVQLKPFRIWLKTGACFGHFEACPAGGLTFVPSSLSYEDCSDDEMREFHHDALEFLRSPYGLHRLWPAMTPQHRAETLEALLATPHEGDT